MKRVVLAYSGGLDTCVILHWIRETHGAEVITYTGDVGQGEDELAKARRAAEKTGAAQIIVEDLREAFVTECIFPALRANAVYEWYYLMGTALARPVLAKGLVVDIGGLLSHGSIVAREYGIPGVLNVMVGTKLIKTGQIITVDGAKGEVYLHEE